MKTVQGIANFEHLYKYPVSVAHLDKSNSGFATLWTTWLNKRLVEKYSDKSKPEASCWLDALLHLSLHKLCALLCPYYCSHCLLSFYVKLEDRHRCGHEHLLVQTRQRPDVHHTARRSVPRPLFSCTSRTIKTIYTRSIQVPHTWADILQLFVSLLGFHRGHPPQQILSLKGCFKQSRQSPEVVAEEHRGARAADGQMMSTLTGSKRLPV
eukprot:2972760-Amphidinium_carterae.1